MILWYFVYVNLHEGYEGYILRNASCKVVSIFSTKASVSYVHNGYRRQGYLTLTQASMEKVTTHWV